MRLLLPADRAGVAVEPDADEALLCELYAYPAGRWLRANMISTLDGAATGPDGLTGSLASDADQRVFAVLRTLADVVLVGAGTARAEGYGPEAPRAAFSALRAAQGRRPAAPFALVTRSGDVPTDTGLFDGGLGTMVVTCAAAGEAALARLRDLAGEGCLVVAGQETVDLVAALDELAARGMRHVLCEGGPVLLSAVIDAGALDELCLTWSPVLATGGPAIASAASPGRRASLGHLLAGDDGTVIGRWVLSRRPAS